MIVQWRKALAKSVRAMSNALGMERVIRIQLDRAQTRVRYSRAVIVRRTTIVLTILIVLRAHVDAMY